jgi:hypothetical protein
MQSCIRCAKVLGGGELILVHVFCTNEECRRVFHLDDNTYLNFKGTVKCIKCGKEFEIEIRKGRVLSSKKTDKK